MAALTLIPVAAGLLTVFGNRPGLGAVTSLAILAMVMMAAVSLLFVLGSAPFSADVDGYYAGLVFVSRLAPGRRPRGPGLRPAASPGRGWGVALVRPGWPEPFCSGCRR